jgi:hypothetical protein
MPCYFCGEKKTSKEHVPPEQIFKAVTCDKITVPSCDIHNTGKSGQDDSVIKAMLLSLDKEWPGIDPTITKSIELAKPHYDQVKKSVKLIQLLNEPIGIDTNVAYIMPDVDIDNWLAKMSAALLYSGIKFYDSDNDLKNIFVFNATHYNSVEDSLSPEEMLRQYVAKNEIIDLFESIPWTEGWKSGKTNYPKELFNFYITIVDRMVFFRLHFFSNYLFYTGINVSEKTIKVLVVKRKIISI